LGEGSFNRATMMIVDKCCSDFDFEYYFHDYDDVTSGHDFAMDLYSLDQHFRLNQRPN
jgi:hypothetical protein